MVVERVPVKALRVWDAIQDVLDAHRAKRVRARAVVVRAEVEKPREDLGRERAVGRGVRVESVPGGLMPGRDDATR